MKYISVFDSSSEKKIDILYERSDNVVAIKRKIRKTIYLNETQMILYNGDLPLGDNEYIEEDFQSLSFKELTEESNDIIITVGRNTLRIPELIQINPDKTISELISDIMFVSHNSSPMVVFDEEGNELTDNFTVEKCGLWNDSKVMICQKDDLILTLNVSHIAPLESSFKIECKISEKIVDVKQKISSYLHLNSKISLFTEWNILEDEKRMIDYSFRNNDSLSYIPTDNIEDIEINEKIKKGKFSKIFMGKNLVTNKEIVLKRYNLKSKKFDQIQPFKNELTILKKFDSEQGLVNMDYIFQTSVHFYVGLEYMKKGSLNIGKPLDTNEIINHSLKILRILKYLHKHEIVYRNLKCSSLLLDENDNLKLCNFHLSKILMDFKNKKIVENFLFSKKIEYNWTAPEVLRGDSYDTKADIWSLGATIIEMITGNIPYPELKQEEVRSMILKNETIIYNTSYNQSVILKTIIYLCLQADPTKRPTAEELLQILGSQESGNN